MNFFSGENDRLAREEARTAPVDLLMTVTKLRDDSGLVQGTAQVEKLMCMC